MNSHKAAGDLQFEGTSLLRDQIKELKRMVNGEKSEKAKVLSYKKLKQTKK